MSRVGVGLNVCSSEFPGFDRVGTKNVPVDLFELVPLVVVPPRCWVGKGIGLALGVWKSSSSLRGSGLIGVGVGVSILQWPLVKPVIVGKGMLLRSSGRSGRGRAQGRAWGSLRLYDGTGSGSVGALGSSSVVGRAGLVVDDGWEVRVRVWLSILPAGPWVCLNPYIPLVNRRNGLRSVVFSSRIGGSMGCQLIFCRARGCQLRVHLIPSWMVSSVFSVDGDEQFSEEYCEVVE
ncbi:hypothetical protein ARMGADRAFT_1040248 [Armillaria gallica]|uniref:Uncharacterized protein n=1 Tax=Armillaria gallica TaxID=47427 RepID=A0A2H3CAS0_ARMGA|nr:hypothetical protein ARMGADRAFT_1040248 [Armillaria gallica]